MMRRWVRRFDGLGRSVRLGGFDDPKHSSGDGRPFAAIRSSHPSGLDLALLAWPAGLSPGRACRPLVLDHRGIGKTKYDQARRPAPDHRSSVPRRLLRVHQRPRIRQLGRCDRPRNLRSPMCSAMQKRSRKQIRNWREKFAGRPSRPCGGSDHDDRQCESNGFKHRLHFQSPHVGHLDVQQDATVGKTGRRPQKGVGRRIRDGDKSHRSQEQLQRAPHCRIIVNHMNGPFSRHRALCHAELLGA